MATVYVSQSASNGYAIGSDSNTYAQAQSKSTPKLTLASAWSAISAGDTIIINDGTYSMGTYTTLGSSKTDVTIKPENDYMVTFTSTGSSYILLHGATAPGLTIGKIIIDAEYAKNTCVFGDSSAVVGSVIYDGTRFIRFNVSALNYSKAQNVTLKGGWSAYSDAINGTNPYPFRFTVVATGNIDMEDGEVDVNCLAASTYTLTIVNSSASVEGCNFKVKNVKARYGSANADMSLQFCGPSGFTSYEFGENDFKPSTLQSSSGGMDCIKISNSSVAIAQSVKIYNNKLDGGNPDPADTAYASGHCICIGEDADTSANANRLNGIHVWGNECVNSNHLLFLGWVSDAVVEGNICDNGVIGAIGKHTTNCLVNGNIITEVGQGGSLRDKAGTNNKFINNTVILTKSNGVGLNATDSINESTGCEFTNNIVYMDGVSAHFVIVADGSSTFTNNCYYTNAALSSEAFEHGTSIYATIETWKAAMEATAINAKPKFVNYPSDLRVLPTDTNLYHKGAYTYANVRDFKGRRFNVKPTIGAYEVAGGDRALTRTSRA